MLCYITVGNQIEFWDMSDCTWLRGEIAYIRVVNDSYFVFLRINYWYRKKQKNIDIYREDWLRIHSPSTELVSPPDNVIPLFGKHEKSNF